MSKERVIKFRCWDKSAECFRDEFKMSFDGTLWYNSVVGIRKCHQENYVLMQFTGLYDKEGKEVYEKDIIQVGLFALNDSKKYGERPWENLPEGVNSNDLSTLVDTFEVSMDPKGLYEIYEIINSNPDVVGVQVIGNIYTTPELLEPPKS
jgi:uncharacterized phage protein (TIGR01671 family)